MRKNTTPPEPRDLGVLTLSRLLIDTRGPLSDGQLVDMLDHCGVPSTAARASLVRLEASRHLTFGASGWEAPAGRVDPLSW